MFTQSFDKYACAGDSITCEVDGFHTTATIHRDDYSGAPWENSCGHGVVTDWTSRGKNAGELILNEDRGSYRYYDFAEAVKTAKKEGWGPGTPADAARKGFDGLKAWCNDEWYYCGIVLTVRKAGIKLDDSSSFWRIECNYPGSDNSYLRDVANELLPEALGYARAKLAELTEAE